MRRGQVGRALFPLTRLDVMAMATRKPARYHCAATRWSLDDFVAACAQGRHLTMSRSSIWPSGGGGPQTPPERLLAQQPRPRFRGQSAQHLCLIPERPRIL